MFFSITFHSAGVKHGFSPNARVAANNGTENKHPCSLEHTLDAIHSWTK